jgi:hypothetical protein
VATVKYTVRVVMFKNSRLNPPIPGIWLEQMRHLGVCRILGENDDRAVLEFPAPAGTMTQTWANMEADRMQSFGLNAVAAPTWTGGKVPELV